MGAYDRERMILTDVELVHDTETCFIPEPTEGTVDLLSAVRDTASWIESDRPDLYSDDHHLAVEVMRVDDHPKVGKITNPTLARESDMEREFRSAFPAMDPDVPVIVIANTGLPQVKDHNFPAYREAFARTVANHASKVAAYRESHAGYGLALLVRDESSAYVEARGDNLEEMRFLGHAHLWFLDASFTQVIAQSGADFVLWHTPFKHIWHHDAFGRRLKANLPALAVYDVAAMENWTGQLVYDADRLVSVEE